MPRLLVTLLSISLLLASCAPREKAETRKVIQIGLVAGLSGPTAAWGEALRRGAELAVEEVNRGQRPYQLVLRVEDDGGKAEDAAALVTRLITRDGVSAIIGNDSSSKTLAMVPVCEQYGVPLVAPTASNIEVTRRSKLAFRVCATDDHEARAAADLALRNPRTRRAAILRDVRNDYSTGLAAEFERYFVARGGVITIKRDYSQGDSDFRAQLTAIAASRPDILFVPGYYPDVAQIVTQAREVAIKFPLLGGSGWDSPKLVEIGGENVDGSFFVSGERSARPDFVQKFQQKYKTAPDSANALTFDAVMLIAASLDAGRGEVSTLKDGLTQIKRFPGASGEITMEADRNPRKSLAVFQVQKGIFVQTGSVTPEQK